MLLIYMLSVWQTLVLAYRPFNMYKTDTNNRQDGFCLLYYLQNAEIVYYEDPYPFEHEIIPYCLRSSEEISIGTDLMCNNTFDDNFTFTDLLKKNISSELLLSWSAPIDLIEHYQIFLNNVTYSPPSGKEELFYNCTPPWFGPLCCFAFDLQIEESSEEYFEITDSFSKIIEANFDFSHENVTCYTHLKCQTSLSCLNWRDICNRQIDCSDGSDEFDCWQLEINECNMNEYRCHNGQCIPAEFFHDVLLNPDCLDQTDEPDHSLRCVHDPGFRCEEHTCRPRASEDSCYGGECGSEILNACRNRRGRLQLDDPCSNAMVCVMNEALFLDHQKWCEENCIDENCVNDNCPPLFEFPSYPIAFGHVRFMFKSKEIENGSGEVPLPDYVCYNEELCSDFLPATEHFNGSSCRHFHQLELDDREFRSTLDTLVSIVRDRFRGCLGMINDTQYCNHSTMYRCQNSTKCISKYRLVDGISDCPLNDDETFNQSCSLNDAHRRFNCLVDTNTKCLAPLMILDGKEDCTNGQDEHQSNIKPSQEHIFFQMICDGKTELLPVLIDDRNETDETECEHWPCNNTYTRCDRIWTCADGADEINCPPSTCPELQHSCVFPNDTSKVSCLPINRVNDGLIDCLGVSDERKHCRTVYPDNAGVRFRCLNDTKCVHAVSLCDHSQGCPLNDDENFCTHFGTVIFPICTIPPSNLGTKVQQFLCNMHDANKRPMIYFTLRYMPTYSLQLSTNIVSSTLPVPMNTIRSIEMKQLLSMQDAEEWKCHRGLRVRIRMDDSTSTLSCLCPPSYYGNQCQYQNQRVSLSIQIRVTSDWRNVFALLITLIDDEGNIESHDHIEYLPIRDCDIKFHVYLLYSTRPKNTSKNYSVRIDAFNKLTLDYRATWIYPLRFSFLPVHRSAVLLTVPISNAEPLQQCTPSCIHGQCFRYANDQNSTFCRCEPGWSGRQCTIKYVCNCASGSLCINDAICLCSLGRFGSRCHLLQVLCHSHSCANNGQCIPPDERYASTSLYKSTCICSKEYSGNYCEQQQTRIDISFQNSVAIPPSLLIHFITVQNEATHIRTSTMKKIPFDQTSLTLYTTISFNIAFVEIFRTYYVLILHEELIVSPMISAQVRPSHRCVSIHELFNETIVNLHLLRRIKYYHLPCKQRPELVCFYDDIHFCLCNLDQQANCFEFDHNMNYNCRGYSSCENDGQCFHDDPKCPTSTICVCQDCYYGSRCQFSTIGSTLSLDTIIGYQIHPNVRLNRQPIVVKISIILTTTMFGFGLISSLLSFLTFQSEITRNVGCGLYLFTSSITSIITMSVFTVKFCFLLASQMGSINNRSFIHAQCISIDFLLRILLNSGDWISACVAIERAVNISTGIHFNKAKSKQIAKWIILIVFLSTTSSHIHDPIHRHLIDDEEEQRTWCITKYSSSLQMYDWILNIIHFSIPFAINCISALIIIINAARNRSNTQKNKSYNKVLFEQFQHHKHLLISPFILVLLALPRLIISFLSGCMKSARNPWLYLIGYFISFIPPMLLFVVFVLPSKMYREEFSQSFKRVWRR